MSKIPEIRQAAPRFTLPGVHLAAGRAQRREYSRSEPRGRALILAFYPGDETMVCTRQMCTHSAGLDELASVGAHVRGISPQGVESHEHLARKHDLTMPLLADTGMSVAGTYGITLAASLRRSVYLLDSDGIIRWRPIALLGVAYRSVETLLKQVRGLTAQAR